MGVPTVGLPGVAVATCVTGGGATGLGIFSTGGGGTGSLCVGGKGGSSTFGATAAA